MLCSPTGTNVESLCVEIRPAQSTDLDQLYDLWHERLVIWSQVDQRFETLAQQQRDSWIAQRTKQLTSSTSAIFVGTSEDRVIGYIQGQISTKAIVEMLVLDAHRYHGGLGRALWKALSAWFKDHDFETFQVKVPRRSLVEQTFWRSLGAIESQLGDGETSSPEWIWLTL